MKYLDKDVTLALGRTEFMAVTLPKGFDLQKAQQIREEMEKISQKIAF